MNESGTRDEFFPELGQMLFSNGGWQEHDLPEYMVSGLMTLACAIEAQRYGDAADGTRILTSNYGEEDFCSDVFSMRSYCWCDGELTGHEQACPPNFEMPGADVVVRWYKHVGRGASVNRPVSALEWARLLVCCLEAVVSGAQAAVPVNRVEGVAPRRAPRNG